MILYTLKFRKSTVCNYIALTNRHNNLPGSPIVSVTFQLYLLWDADNKHRVF